MKKKITKSVPIASLGDLVHLVNHNCEVLHRRTVKLARSNRNLKMLCVLAFGYAVHAVSESRKQEEKVYQLSVRVNKLERGEGD